MGGSMASPDALELLARFGEDGRPVAGGQSLVPMMNLRLARPAHLVDINALPLDRIEFDGLVMRIGALVRHERYFGEPRIKTHFPAFLDAVHWIGFARQQRKTNKNRRWELELGRSSW